MFACTYCGKCFAKKFNMERHTLTCRHVFTDLNLQKERYLDLENQLFQARKQAEFLQRENETLSSYLAEAQKHVRELEARLENIAVKVAAQPKKSYHHTHNQYIQNLQPIMPDTFSKYVDKLTINHINKGAEGYAEYFHEYPLKNALLCTDFARSKFVFKNEDGTVVQDPFLTTLGKKLFEAIENRNTELIQQCVQRENGLWFQSRI